MSTRPPGGPVRFLIALAGVLVPGSRRAEWKEEWYGELAALDEAREGGVEGLPSSLGFAAGALPHALWMRTEGWTMDSVLLDLKFAARVLRRAPGFTVVAALTLALGIGANAAIFSLVNGLVLKPPPGVSDADRLVQIARSYETDPRWDNFSYPAMQLIRSEARAFSGVAGYSFNAFTLGEGMDTEQVGAQYVSGDYFDVLGVRPHVGRLIQPSDDIEPGAHAVVVLSHALWVDRYGQDLGVVGRTVPIGARPYEIIGVTPPGFAGVESIGTPPSFFIPMMQDPGYRGELLFDEWGASWISVVGRLADGVAFDEASSSMSVVDARLRESAAVNEGIQVLLAEGVGLDPDGRRDAARISTILALIVAVVLLLTCTNVANLFLARATGRRTEIGVRMALGAGRSRLVRQLMTESTVLALLATLLAVPIVLAAGDLLPILFPFRLNTPVGADTNVFLFLTAIGLGTGLLFGAAPAWAAARRDLARTMREGAGTGGRDRMRLRDGLVVVQLALSLGLVAGAALLGRSVMNANAAEPGFQPRGVLAATVDLSSTGRYDADAGLDFFRRLIDGAQRTPGVRAATVANQMPLIGGHSRASVQPTGRDDANFEAEYIVVGPRYFETLGVPLVRGRYLGGIDDEPEPVVVINERLASMFWPGQNPVGQELEGSGGVWRVVGVVGDVQMRSLRAQPNPAVYYPLSQAYSAYMVLHLATEPGSGLRPADARGIVAQVDAQLPVAAVLDLGTAAARSMGETRTFGYLVAAFALLALVLAIVGLYGLVSYSASQRVREIGIRIALGAEPDSLVQLILRHGIGLTVVGIAVGFAVAYGLGSTLRGLLFGVSHTDPIALAVASGLLLAAAVLAAWVPARRASRVDAAVSLRD